MLEGKNFIILSEEEIMLLWNILPERFKDLLNPEVAIGTWEIGVVTLLGDLKRFINRPVN